MFTHIDSLPALIISIALGFVGGVAIFVVVHWMLEGALELLHGIAAIVLILLVVLVTIMSKSNVVAGVVLVGIVTLMAFLPYAVDQLAKAEVRGMDVDKLDRVHREISERPENVASYFLIAELVYGFGLHGHAVAITERTLERLSTAVDPIKNQSMREVFRAEESRCHEWRRKLVDRAAFRPVACPRCGHRNEPGTIACGQCQGPFLLDLARRIDPRPRVRSKLVFGWALVALFFTATVYGWSQYEGTMRLVVLGGGLVVVAGAFTWLFHPRTLGRA